MKKYYRKKDIDKELIYHFELGFRNAARGILPKSGENYEVSIELGHVKTATGAYKKGAECGRWVAARRAVSSREKEAKNAIEAAFKERAK